MATVNPRGSSIRYAGGQKMGRISFDVDIKACKKFKQLLLRGNQSLAGVLRPVIEKYIEDNGEPHLV